MKIDFSQNWNNKLKNKLFTTIRTYSKKKEKDYLSNVGKKVQINLKGKKLFKAKLSKIEVRKFKEIPEELLILNSGAENAFEAWKIFKGFGISLVDKVIVLYFKNDNKNTI